MIGINEPDDPSHHSGDHKSRFRIEMLTPGIIEAARKLRAFDFAGFAE